MSYLLIGHQIHYSYTADQGYIQSVEQNDRRQRLADALASGGSTQSDLQAESLLFRGVNYVADNLVFAGIYTGFFVVSGALAGLCLLARFFEQRGRDRGGGIVLAGTAPESPDVRG